MADLNPLHTIIMKHAATNGYFGKLSVAQDSYALGVALILDEIARMRIEERERCALVCEQQDGHGYECDDGFSAACRYNAEAIRALSVSPK